MAGTDRPRALALHRWARGRFPRRRLARRGGGAVLLAAAQGLLQGLRGFGGTRRGLGRAACGSVKWPVREAFLCRDRARGVSAAPHVAIGAAAESAEVVVVSTGKPRPWGDRSHRGVLLLHLWCGAATYSV